LLLLQIYQQSSRRSHESWTSHSLAVKTAYQLGIHVPSSYEHMTPQEKENRSRLWFATVNQDRTLSYAFGQPCLIPPQHVRREIMEMVTLSNNSRAMNMQQLSKESIKVFQGLTSLHEIAGHAIESLHGSNIDPSYHVPLPQIISKTLELSLMLESWATRNAPYPILTSAMEMGSWNRNSFESNRGRIVLSLFYYRNFLLSLAPLLMAALERLPQDADTATFGLLEDTVLRFLREDVKVIKALSDLIRCLLTYDPSFFARNGIWWICNYAALTMSLHSFALWLALGHHGVKIDPLTEENASLESMLRTCLDLLKDIGANSEMSARAHCCLQRYYERLRNRESPDSTPGPPAMQPAEPTPQTGINTEQGMSCFPGTSFVDPAVPSATETEQSFGLYGLNSLDFLDLDMDITEFDAVGLL